MYVKTTSRKIKDGAEVRYLHLAHNQWDPAKQRSTPTILYSFGREDALDRDAIKRLVASLSRLLDPADALAATAGSDLVFLESRPVGRGPCAGRAVAAPEHRHDHPRDGAEWPRAAPR